VISPMLKSELIDQLINKLPQIGVQVVEDATNHLLDTMTKALNQGKRIEIRGFGCFSVRTNAARQAINPKTGERFIAPAKNRIHFKPGKELKEKVNK